VGDPIELAAVAKSLKEAGRTDELIVGSVKANVSTVRTRGKVTSAEMNRRSDISKVLPDSQA
jgi:hypothetical protein